MIPLPVINYVTPKLLRHAEKYQVKHPYFDLPDYMIRKWVFEYKWYTLGYSARIHKILRSDEDRAFHDHPWPYITIILEGGYWEHRPVYKEGIYVGETKTWYGPGSVLRRQANHLHRLELPEGQTATTLFIMGRWEQRWGFVANPKWKIYWKDYLEAEDSTKPAAPPTSDLVEYLAASCTLCRGLTFLARYESTEEKMAAKDDFFRLLEEDRNPFVLKLESEADFPKWCSCNPTHTQEHL
jgi:hypothetical protein